MKYKLNLLKKVFAATILTLFLTTNCQQEIMDQKLIETGSKISVKKISKQNLYSNDNLLATLEKITSSNKKSKSINSRIISDSIYGFSINTDYALYIEHEGYHSYTFEILRGQDNGYLENLLLSLQSDGSYKAFIIEYSAESSDSVSADTRVNSTELDSSFNSNEIISEVLREIDCIVTDINVLGDDGVEYESLDECASAIGYGSCISWVVVYYANCPNAIYPAPGNSSGGGSTSGDGSSGNNSGSNGDTNNSGNDGSGTEDTTNDPGSDTSTSGGTTNNTEDDNSTGNPPDEGEDCILDSDGNCIDDITAPIRNEKTTDEKNCEELNKLTSNPPANTTNPFLTEPFLNPDGLHKNTRIAITNIDNQLSSNYEHGYGFYNNGEFAVHGPYAHHVPASADDNVHFPAWHLQFGTIHTHPDNDIAIPMFSHGDIYTLLQVQTNYSTIVANPNGNALFVTMLVVKQAGQTKTYAIKIDDITKLQGLEAIYQNNKDWDDFGEDLREAYEDNANGVNGSSTDYQKTFLNFVKDQDLGISLYQMEQTHVGTPFVQEKWKKLTLSTDGNSVMEEPCNS